MKDLLIRIRLAVHVLRGRPLMYGYRVILKNDPAGEVLRSIQPSDLKHGLIMHCEFIHTETPAERNEWLNSDYLKLKMEVTK